ncbi:MAG: acyl-CoA dehydratase activase [Clostridiales bacterium]|nr:acyl-CoA dehydratase activase [Clostridiales bacterium]
MNKTYYICKYTPVELLTALGAECTNLNGMPDGFDLADQTVHPNICGFGKALLEAVMKGEVKELVLVNCCDTIRSVYDVLEYSGKLDFLYMMDMLHSDGTCSRECTVVQLKALAQAYGEYKGTSFDEKAFHRAFVAPEKAHGPHISVMGARMGDELFEMVQEDMPYPVENDTCVNNRSVGEAQPPEEADYDVLLAWYAQELLGQIPCMRMMDPTGRKQLYNDPDIKGVIYHTVKFCDFYSFEYAQLKQNLTVPLLKIESDYTIQSSGQLSTRLEAFAESMESDLTQQNGKQRREKKMGKGYFAGIDSGSTSTDVVILDREKQMVTGIILPTGAGAAIGAERALEEALKEAHLEREDIDAMVTTGYGRTAISDGDKSITEITCHARGAHFLDPDVRTVIDIGGQDSKVIRMDASGAVENFVMNDKCAAGTGRFLEMMARTMEMSLDEMSKTGLHYKEDITISSMCTVFAESEVVSLIAQNKATDDIVHGLNKAVATKTVALAKRVGGVERYMMTGGVSKNQGLVKTLEEKLGTTLVISDKAQLCGALGAALYAMDMVEVRRG